MSVIYLLGRNPLASHIAYSGRFVPNIRIFHSLLTPKLRISDIYPRLSPNFPQNRAHSTVPSTLASNPTQVYKLVIDNHSNLNVSSLLKYAEILHGANLSDSTVTGVLADRLLADLDSVTNVRKMTRFFRLLEPCSTLTDEFFAKVVGFIHAKKVYPGFGMPRTWTTYFRFFGINRILHAPLYDDLIAIFVEYLSSYLFGDAVDPNGSPKMELNKRLQESIATASWCLSIVGVRNPTLAECITRMIGRYRFDTGVLVRIYWSFAIQGAGLGSLAPAEIHRLLTDTLSTNSIQKLSHVNQVLTAQRSDILDPQGAALRQAGRRRRRRSRRRRRARRALDRGDDGDLQGVPGQL